jgi:hypothetical protein
MTTEELQFENKLLREEVENLKKELFETKERLQQYTNGKNHKKYYEKNKELIKQKANENKLKLKETNPEKIKEYAHRAYLKQKEKKKLENI